MILAIASAPHTRTTKDARLNCLRFSSSRQRKSGDDRRGELSLRKAELCETIAHGGDAKARLKHSTHFANQAFSSLLASGRPSGTAP